MKRTASLRIMNCTRGPSCRIPLARSWSSTPRPRASITRKRNVEERTMLATSREPYLLNPDEGDDLWVMGGLYSFKAVGASNENAYTLCEVQGPPGLATPMHIHEREDEAFYLAAGHATLFMDDKERPLLPGSFGFVPRGNRHGFR